jgi:hypothetical protein
VYPTADIELDPALPARAEFWVPEPDEIDDYEGFGLFQDVWPIVGVSADDAAAVAREDRLLCRIVGDLARDATDFDVLAAVVETGSVGEDDEITAERLAALAPYLTGKAALESLEAGVAGLVGFDFDPVRPELLVVKGRSVEDTLRLGAAMLATIEAFRSLG